MARPGVPTPPRDPYLTLVRAGAIASVAVSGTLALLALVFGSPLQFGIALAVCAGWWIADDFVASTLDGRRAVPAARPRPNYSANHPVFAGKRPQRHSGSGSIAA